MPDGKLTYDRAAELLNSRFGTETGVTGVHLARIDAGYERSRQIGRQFVPLVYDGDLLIFPATREDGTTRARSPEEWRPIVTGRIDEHPVDCSHNEMIEPQSLSVIGPVLARLLSART